MKLEIPELNEPFLIIDDESDYLESMVLLLAILGYEVLTSTGGQDALEKIRTRKPFLVLADFRMPEKDGLEICETARKEGYENAFVLITGYADKDLAMRAIKLGVNEILEKPVVSETMRKAIRKYADIRLSKINKLKAEAALKKNGYAAEAREALSINEHFFLRMELDVVEPSLFDLVLRNLEVVARGAAEMGPNSPLDRLARSYRNLLHRFDREAWQPSEATLDLLLKANDMCRLALTEFLTPSAASPTVAVQVEKMISTLELSLGFEVAPGGSSRRGLYVTDESIEGLMKLAVRMVSTREPGEVTRLARDLQDQLHEIRRVSLAKSLSHLPRLTLHTSRDVAKEVRLETRGCEIDVERPVALAVSTAITALIRNAIDHGIEKADRRHDLGKNREGVVVIEARESNDSLIVSVRDDGAGIDRMKVTALAVGRGLLKERAAVLDDREVSELICSPGFSTSENVTPISGRGLGLNVVKSLLGTVNGRLSVTSRDGQGACFEIEVPIVKRALPA